MRASGNGWPEVCANNLLRMFIGEVPFERAKGLNPRLIDSPTASARLELEQDAEITISSYEPRVMLEGVQASGGDAPGGMKVTANVTVLEG